MHLYLFIFVLLCCVFADIQYYKIHNDIILSGLLLGCLQNVFLSGLSGFLFFIIGVILPLLFLFPLFLFRMMGAGDLKMLAVVGGYFGSLAVIKCILFSFLFAALYAVCKLLLYQNLRARMKYFHSYISCFILTKKINPYERFHGETAHLIHFSIPVFLSAVLHIGGFY